MVLSRPTGQLGIVRKGTRKPSRGIWEVQGDRGGKRVANISKAVRMSGHELDGERRLGRCRACPFMGAERLTFLHDVRDPLK